MKAADLALYEAKRQGRDRVVPFDARMVAGPRSDSPAIDR